MRRQRVLPLKLCGGHHRSSARHRAHGLKGEGRGGAPRLSVRVLNSTLLPQPFSEEYLKLVEEMEKAQGGEIPEEDGHEGTGHEEGRQEEDHGEEGHVEEHDNEQQAAEVKADEEPEPAPAAEPKEEEPAQEEKPTAKFVWVQGLHWLLSPHFLHLFS